MSEEIENLKEKALQLFEEKNWDELIQVANEIINLKAEPYDQAITNFFLGCAYGEKGDDNRALKNYTQAINLDDELPHPYLGSAYIHHKRGEYEFELENLTQAIKYDKSLKSHVSSAYIASQISAIDNLGKNQKSEAFEIYSKLCNTVIGIRHELFYTSEELKSGVAHYTSLHTLENLSEKGECFRLYNADYMNDPEEGRVFFKIMDKEYRVNIEEWFYEGKDKSYRSPAYIGSFVLFEGEDKLSLWRTYGKHDNEEAAGACLIFNDAECFAESMPYQHGSMAESLQPININMMGNEAIKDRNNVQKLALYKIYYRAGADNELKEELKKLEGQLKNTEKIINDEVQGKKIKEKLEILGKQFEAVERITNNGIQKEKIKEELAKLGKQLEIIKKFIENVQAEETKNTLRRLVRELLDSIRFLFKERYYRDEKERRVILWRYGERDKSSESQIKPDTENIPPRFYVEAPKNFRFNEVRLGPMAKHVEQWKRWFKAQDEDIKINKSKIPYGKS